VGERIRSRVPAGVLIAVDLIIMSTGLTAVPAAAQLLYGSVVGIVKDSTGARLPGAAVIIVNTDTNLTLEATTDAQGNYSLITVLPGPYALSVTLQGFREVKRLNVPVTIGQISRIDVTMEVATLSETVMVLAESPLLQTDVADVHTELKSTELRNLPL